MATEIERKFLVTNEQWREHVLSESRLKQGYLANQINASIRVRMGNGKAHLNIKSTTIGISRSEFEYEVPTEDAEAMLREVAQQPFIDKTRYKVRCGGHVWDLDVFEGRTRDWWLQKWNWPMRTSASRYRPGQGMRSRGMQNITTSTWWRCLTADGKRDLQRFPVIQKHTLSTKPRHPGEGRDPGNATSYWIPAFAGMTGSGVSGRSLPNGN